MLTTFLNYHILTAILVIALIFTYISMLKDSQSTISKPANFASLLNADELQFLYSFKQLLLLHGISETDDKISFASDDGLAPASRGRLQVYRMEPHDDYVKFYLSQDEARAIRGFETRYTSIDQLSVTIPLNGSDFEEKWRNGKFIECLNLNVSENTSQAYIGETFVHRMAQFREFIEHYNSIPILFCGTLLGWYRECGFIKDTTDVDFAMRITELNQAMINDLRSDQLFKLYWILGKVDDSLELSVHVDSVKIDLFFIYNDGGNDWIGGMIVPEKAKLKWTYPHISDLCVGDLYGELFNVPCNVEDVLKAEYGVNWTIPHRDASFVWYESSKNVERNGYWNESEWSTVFKQFGTKK